MFPGFPAILNVSVTKIGETDGSIFVSWAKPRNFDTLAAPGPYVFRIFRSTTQQPADFVVIDSVSTADLNDTTYVDQPLNTLVYPYYYMIKMYNNTPGRRFEMRPGESEIASSLYIDITPGDNSAFTRHSQKGPLDQQSVYNLPAEFIAGL